MALEATAIVLRDVARHMESKREEWTPERRNQSHTCQRTAAMAYCHQARAPLPPHPGRMARGGRKRRYNSSCSNWVR